MNARGRTQFAPTVGMSIFYDFSAKDITISGTAFFIGLFTEDREACVKRRVSAGDGYLKHDTVLGIDIIGGAKNNVKLGYGLVMIVKSLEQSGALSADREALGEYPAELQSLLNIFERAVVAKSNMNSELAAGLDLGRIGKSYIGADESLLESH